MEKETETYERFLSLEDDNKADFVNFNKHFIYDIEFESSNDIEEGYVIKTKPRAGSSKKKGSKIIIVESTGTEDVVLKDYTNQNAENLKTRLERR